MIHWNKIKSIFALTLKFSKWGKYLTTKRCSKYITKTMSSLRDILKNVWTQWTVIPTQNFTFMYNLRSKINFFNKSIDAKSLKWRFFASLGYESIISLKQWIRTLTVTHDLLRNPENSLIKKRTLLSIYSKWFFTT